MKFGLALVGRFSLLIDLLLGGLDARVGGRERVFHIVALAADRVLFNSLYHQTAYLDQVEAVLAKMPDHVPDGVRESIEAKSDVFPVGIDFDGHDPFVNGDRAWNDPPRILWNHRWEYDKDPDAFVG